VFLGNSNEDPRREEQLAFRFLGQVEGLILASSRLPDDKLREIAAIRPLVLVNRDMEGIPRVLIDSAGGIAEAAAHLANLGHRHVAYVSGPLESWSNTHRAEALIEACEKYGLALTLLPAQVPTFEAGEAISEAFLETGATVAVAFDDLTAHGLLNALAAKGVRVPEDVAVVGCDDVLARLTNPPLTTIGNRSPDAGKFALRLLNGLLRSASPTVSDERIVLETALVVRASTA
jgi:LacI family transcriptional regulator